MKKQKQMCETLGRVEHTHTHTHTHNYYQRKEATM